MRGNVAWHQTDRYLSKALADFQRKTQMAMVHGVKGTAINYVHQHQFRMCPSPNTTYFCDVNPSSPTGPRACILSVEIPISAPRPYSKPSAKRVEAFTITELESTSVIKRRARV